MDKPEPWDELGGGGGNTVVAYLCPGEALASVDLLRDECVEGGERKERKSTGYWFHWFNICEQVLVPVDSPRIRVVSELLWTVRRS